MVIGTLLWQCNRHGISAWSIRTQTLRSTLPGQYATSSLSGCYRLFSTLAKDNSIASEHADTDILCSATPFRNEFIVTAPYEPTGDQPQAIDRLTAQVLRGDKFSILRGITGTGKTNVMAHTIARLGRPTLVLCHNKTLAAQVARELRACLSKNHVQLFVSYYNHYVPESFNEVTDRYTSKKSSINDELDALRHLATRALVQHKDVVIVASVSCIYGMGMPKSYLEASLKWSVGETRFENPGDIATAMQSTVYTPTEGNDDDLKRGQYQLSQDSTGATLVLWPPSETYPMRVDFAANDDGACVISSISHGQTRGMKVVQETTIFPAKHHLTSSPDQFEEALTRIQNELHSRVNELKAESKHFEADRLMQRVSQDLQLLRETGTCSGVENYSRHMGLREAGEPPDTLLDYFGSNDWLLMVDESHVTLSQLKAMYGGDRSRKERLVKHGFRLPSALDNRPLKDEEFWSRIPQAIFVSATPSKQEMSLIDGVNQPIDMIIRPTYVCDPDISVRPTEGQLNDLLTEIRVRASRDERTLVMTLTKRDAEDLADYLIDHDILATYIHSSLNTHERSNALKSLQSGEIDCLVGVNLLREGLDLPQVSLVAILNADSEGFLRSETALLQTVGRAARNMHGAAILYANRVTDSMKKCIDATNYRRQYQLNYNVKHGKLVRSTQGSSVLSIFDLLKDEIKAEQPIEVVMAKGETPIVDHDPQHAVVASSSLVLSLKESTMDIVTDHVPSKPGVYFWKDSEGRTLYIGKAKRLRSRVKSYLSPNAKHSSRIHAMLKKASSVEFILTPSDRDALLLENKLIKHHQPIYNVLLKDDEYFPYICAMIGDDLPQLTMVPRRQDGERASKYRYFGPYPRYSELNAILQKIEDKYDLRSKCFQARYGDVSKADYQKLFYKVIEEVFESKGRLGPSSLPALRSKYEEASKLFDSKYNSCRDIIAMGHCTTNESTHVVHVLQLREGLVAGQFSYTVELNIGLHTSRDFGDVIQAVLQEKHYPSGEIVAPGQFSFFPDEVLTQHPLNDAKALKETIRTKRNRLEPERRASAIAIRVASSKGVRHDADRRALQCAIENAAQVAEERSLAAIQGVPVTSVDGTAAFELAHLLSLDDPPQRIECYDISHTQGEGTVASRVVFLNGRPATALYRRFNVQSVEGVDDYASLEEVLERRFRRVWESGEASLVDQNDPWAKPDLVVVDGGKGQLSSALKGMAKANVFPIRGKRANQGYQISVELDNPILEEEDDSVSLTKTVDGHIYVPVISLAKNKEEIFSVNSSMPMDVRPDSAALLLLRAIRDESHRFALKSHRKRRSKANGL